MREVCARGREEDGVFGKALTIQAKVVQCVSAGNALVAEEKPREKILLFGTVASLLLCSRVERSEEMATWLFEGNVSLRFTSSGDVSPTRLYQISDSIKHCVPNHGEVSMVRNHFRW